MNKIKFLNYDPVRREIIINNTRRIPYTIIEAKHNFSIKILQPYFRGKYITVTTYQDTEYKLTYKELQQLL